MTEEPNNHLHQFLRTKYRAVGEAHRTNPRRHCSTPARLSWTQGEKSRVIRARMLDISRAGAALTVPERPPLRVQTQIRLRLAGPEPTPWIEAVVLGVEPDESGRFRVRLKFNDPCPTYFLRVAVLGPITHDDEETDVHSSPEAEPHDAAFWPFVP